MSLIGTLDELKIADVLRLFATGRKSGLLTVSAGGRQAVVHFAKGAVVHAASGRLQGDDAVLDLFGWHEGQLTFVPDERAVTPNVQRATDALILEGIRVGESLHRMLELIPSDRVVFQWGGGPPDGAPREVTAASWRVLRALDGVHDVRELVESLKVPRTELVSTLFALTEAGLAEKVESVRMLRAQPQGALFGGDTAQLDEKVDAEWRRRLLRFANGVHRIEVRSGAGRSATLPVGFRAGLVRDIQLPRATITDLGLREGEEVAVRPAF